MNPARAALSRAVNRAIAEGAPVYVNQPAPQPSVVPLMCDCFFRGRQFFASPDCEMHSTTDDEPSEFKFSELSDRAKEKARTTYRNRDLDYEWWDSTYDDAVTVASMLSIDINTRTVKLYGSGTGHEPCIGFSGFSSQGDGAHFEGRWTPANGPLQMLSAVMEYAPQDDELHEIAFNLAHLSERCNAIIPGAYVSVTQSGYGVHSGCTAFDIELPTPDHVDWESELQMMTWNALVTHYRLDFDTFETEIKQALRGFMDWIFNRLEAEYDCLTSIENIEETLADYTFDEHGEML